MLLLIFRLGEDRYALDAGRIIEVLPLVEIKRMLGAPSGICGTFNYRGRFVPVVDLSERVLDRAAEPRLSTRLVLASLVAEGNPVVIGLIVENATETLRVEAADLIPPAMTSRERPWLGAMIFDARGHLQLIDIDKLLDEDARRSLLVIPAAVA
jgi:chemotaxis-related protein WspB